MIAQFVQSTHCVNSRARACTDSYFKDKDQKRNPSYKIRYRVVKFEDITEIISKQHTARFEVRNLGSPERRL